MLTDSQKRQVAAWIGEGLSLAQVQTKIEEEFGVAMTYMDVRFLVDDLDIELKDDAPAAEENPAASAAPAQQTDASEAETAVPAGTPAAAPASGGGVTLTSDAVQMPGVLAGGDVVFSDGARGKWFLDQTGRPGLEGFPENYRPTPEDMADFQRKLLAELRRLGFA